MLNVTPAAMFIESAIDEMSKEPHSDAERGRCAREIEEASGKGLDIPEDPAESFGHGYYLGLRVAQILQAQGTKL